MKKMTPTEKKVVNEVVEKILAIGHVLTPFEEFSDWIIAARNIAKENNQDITDVLDALSLAHECGYKTLPSACWAASKNMRE